jgi:hypothetical protein
MARASVIDPISVNDYSTSGTVGLTGITGPNVISFNSVAGGSFQAPSAFSLGEFLVGALPIGTTTTYVDTPFEITYLAQKINGAAPDVNQTPLTIKGKLNGTVSGGNQSNVLATFNPMDKDPAFRTGDFLNTLKFGGSALLVPSSNNGGRTTLQAELMSSYSPVPEPATIAVFVVAGLGLGLRRRLRARAA